MYFIFLFTILICTKCYAVDSGISLSGKETLNGTLESKVSTYHLSETELEIWNDPEFKKRFAQSYIAETEIEPRVTVSDREQMQEILDLISSDKLDEAEEILKKNQNETSTAVFDFTLANIYFQQERFDKAAKAYQIAVDKYPKFRRAWKNMGLIYVRKSKFEEAIPALTRVIELGGNSATTYGMLGYSYSSLGNHLCAESAYRKAILLDSHTLDWKKGLARSLFKQESYDDAVSLCKQLVADYPERADLWLLQANAYIGMNKPLKAAEIYEFVDQLDESTPKSLSMLGDIYVNEKLYELAVDSYIRAMKMDPNQGLNKAVRSAKILAARGALKETETLIKNIKDLHSEGLNKDTRKEMLKLQARIAVAEGASEEEIKVLKEIVNLDPMDGEALLLLGQHYNRQGNTEKAIFYYERAAGIDEYGADAKVRHAQVLVKNGKYKEALPLLKQAQQIEHRENVQKYLEQVERIAKSR